MRLIIVRHGETKHNVAKIVQGHIEADLNETGLTQAHKAALRLKDEKIDTIYSSDLARARQTAEAIAKFHNLPIISTPELRERKYGVFEGKHGDELREAVIKSGLHKARFKPEDGESFAEAKERIHNFLNKLIATEKGKTVLVVTHAGVVRAFVGILLNKTPEESIELMPPNASITIIEITDKGHTVHLLNSTEHL